MKIALASDHGGYELKEKVKVYLESKKYEVLDFGTNSLASCHYPEYAYKAAKAVQEKEADLGIVICTTGEGVMITCNKVKGIRCGLAYNDDTARLTREHNNCNILALGAKFVDEETAKHFIDIFLTSKFLGDRHQIRVDLITKYEQE